MLSSKKLSPSAVLDASYLYIIYICILKELTMGVQPENGYFITDNKYHSGLKGVQFILVLDDFAYDILHCKSRICVSTKIKQNLE